MSCLDILVDAVNRGAAASMLEQHADAVAAGIAAKQFTFTEIIASTQIFDIVALVAHRFVLRGDSTAEFADFAPVLVMFVQHGTAWDKLEAVLGFACAKFGPESVVSIVPPMALVTAANIPSTVLAKCVKMLAVGVKDSSVAVAVVSKLAEMLARERNTEVLCGYFEILRILLAVAKVEDVVPVREALFESFSQYFPVLFMPRSSPVTRQEFSVALLQCFAANGAFVEMSVPFLLRNCDETTGNAKVESFLALAVCLDRFGFDVCGGDKLAEIVMDLIDKNGFDTEAGDIVESCMMIVTTILKGSANAIMFASKFIDVCLKHLFPSEELIASKEFSLFNKDESGLARLYLTKLSSIPAGATCAPALTKVLANTLNVYRGNANLKPYVSIIAATIADICEVLLEVPGMDACFQEMAAVLLDIVKNNIGEEMCPVTDASRGMILLSMLPIIPDTVMSEFLACLGDTLMTTTELPTLVTILSGFASSRPEVTVEIILNQKVIPKIAERDEKMLAVLPSLADVQIFAPVLSDTLVRNCCASMDDKLLQALLETMKKGFSTEGMTALMGAFAANAQRICDVKLVRLCHAVMRELFEILCMNPEVQAEMFTVLYQLFVADGKVKPELVPIASILCAALTSLTAENSKAVLANIFPCIAPLCSNPACDNAASMAIAAMLNKTGSDAVLAQVLASGNMLLIAWTARALLLSNSMVAESYASQLVQMCTNDVNLDKAIKCFEVLSSSVKEDEEGLNEQVGAELYAGFEDRMFDSVYAKVSALGGTVTQKVVQAILLSNASQVNFLSNSEYGLSLLFDLNGLVESTPIVARGIIPLIRRFITSSPYDTKQNAQYLVTTLMSIGLKNPMGRMRFDAFDALLLFRDTVSNEVWLPLKESVAADIMPALDDPLRAVRTVAGKCRNSWIIFMKPEV